MKISASEPRRMGKQSMSTCQELQNCGNRAESDNIAEFIGGFIRCLIQYTQECENSHRQSLGYRVRLFHWNEVIRLLHGSLLEESYQQKPMPLSFNLFNQYKKRLCREVHKDCRSPRRNNNNENRNFANG